MNTGLIVKFPEYSGVRCLMMPYIQGDSSSVPSEYAAYRDIIDSVFIRKGDLGFLTIDESPVVAGQAHRGARALTERALHTEAGRIPGTILCGWGSPSYGWGSPTPEPEKPSKQKPKKNKKKPSKKRALAHRVTLDRDVQILLANNLNDSCAVWNAEHEETSADGDIGFAAGIYPYSDATLLKSGEVHQIGILTPHESLPVSTDFNRQFLRIISSGVHGREAYFTQNPLVQF
jgi:hypothetical protein